MVFAKLFRASFLLLDGGLQDGGHLLRFGEKEFHRLITEISSFPGFGENGV